MYLTDISRPEEQQRKSDVLQDGEYARFDIFLMDAGAPPRTAARDNLPAELHPVADAYDAMVRDLTDRSAPARPSSIDEELRNDIAEAAKAAGVSPEDWLAGKTDHDLERMIESVAKRRVSAFRAATVTAALGLDGDTPDPAAAAYDAMVADLQRNA